MAHTIETSSGGAQRPSAQATGPFASARRVTYKIFETLVIWQERAEQRHALGELNSHMLKDIGVSSADAYRESRKPFWIA